MSILGRLLSPVVLSSALACFGAGCEAPSGRVEATPGGAFETIAARDFELEICRKRIRELRAEASLPGAPAYAAHRAEILGRAPGEPAVFVNEPQGKAVAANASTRFGSIIAVNRLAARHRGRPAALRRLVLRDGYVFSSDPQQAFALVKELTLAKLFDEEEIWLHRGETTHRLTRRDGRRTHSYVFADGPTAGRNAKLLFADRLAVQRSALARPLHRDAKSVRNRAGFDRMRILHRSQHALVAELRFGARWTVGLLSSTGARLELSCLDAPEAERDAIARHVAADAPRRRAVARLQATVAAVTDERLPFDRPRGVTDHLSDGQLRPRWNQAYKQGRTYFTHEEQTYLVFDDDGRPTPPQMCVEMILDSYERASGTWYQPRGQRRARVRGALDFGELGLSNRAGVIAFEDFAKDNPQHFEHRRFEGAERIPFRHRGRFFAFLSKRADMFRPGDVIAIHGPKPDGYVHQHAILIEDTDPLTGFPYALADQMRRPRRRTFEMIMAEAPKRSLLYLVRPKPGLLLRLGG